MAAKTYPSISTFPGAYRPNLLPKRVNVDLPAWVVNRLDSEAQRLGLTRQALIKMWIAERLEATAGR
jgi:hypothetical protein